MRILLVEDEPRMAHFIAKGLREQSFAVDTAQDGEAALYQLSINDYDLLLLDVMLPRKDGYAVCREVRAQGLKIPILMLTARDTVDDRVEGLDAGADDYLVKPFAFKELLARASLVATGRTHQAGCVASCRFDAESQRSFGHARGP
jgi:two-component system, OmpR family, copper resistance phosphate regulon response regulator CusR